jgi:hypothetical protein
MNKKLLIISSCLAAIALSSCSSNSSRSRFLSNYDQLKPLSNEYGAKLAYTNPETDFKKYDSIIFDDIVFIVPTDSKLTENDKQRLANNMRSIVYAELSKDYKMVTTPGPTTMRFRGAVTELVPANRTGNLVTTVVPVGRVVAEGQQLSSGVSTFSARGTGELEILDSVTGERLVALSDTRYARKSVSSAATSWGNLESAMKSAARDLRKGLAKLRNR